MRLKSHIMRGFIALLAALASLGTVLLPQASAAPVPVLPASGPETGFSQAGAGAQFTVGDLRSQGARLYRGAAFDTCKAPPLRVMRAWRSASPFGAVGIYFGGRGRACQQKHLSHGWVRSVDQMGWRVLPVYVGSQSPCVRAKNKQHVRMNPRTAVAQGRSEGLNAVQRARALGINAKSPLYLDMESYKYRNESCAATTLRFIKGWNRVVSAYDYIPAFYSSADSGVRHMEKARQAGHSDLPQAMWFARWHTRPTLDAERAMHPRAWTPHRRIHQYDGNVRRSYGGHRLQIDRNAVDAPVAYIG